MWTSAMARGSSSTTWMRTRNPLGSKIEPRLYFHIHVSIHDMNFSAPNWLQNQFMFQGFPLFNIQDHAPVISLVSYKDGQLRGLVEHFKRFPSCITKVQLLTSRRLSDMLFFDSLPLYRYCFVFLFCGREVSWFDVENPEVFGGSRNSKSLVAWALSIVEPENQDALNALTIFVDPCGNSFDSLCFFSALLECHHRFIMIHDYYYYHS